MSKIIELPDRIIPWIKIIYEKTNIKITNFFEIGAHLFEDANRVKFYCNLNDKDIYCFEASPQNFKIAVEKYPSFNSYNIGIHNIETELDFYEDAENSSDGGSNSFLKREYIHIHNPHIIKVKTITMKSFIEQNNIKNIDLCKIDVEGLTYEVLDGFKDKLNIVKVIQAECDDVDNKDFKGCRVTSEVKELLIKNNFEIIISKSNNFHLTPQTDILAINKEYL